jgi:hypothetical protein
LWKNLEKTCGKLDDLGKKFNRYKYFVENTNPVSTSFPQQLIAKKLLTKGGLDFFHSFHSPYYY